MAGGARTPVLVSRSTPMPTAEVSEPGVWMTVLFPATVGEAVAVISDPDTMVRYVAAALCSVAAQAVRVGMRRRDIAAALSGVEQFLR